MNSGHQRTVAFVLILVARGALSLTAFGDGDYYADVRGGGPEDEYQDRQIQQWQIAVQVPPHVTQGAPGNAPPPSNVWIQVPTGGAYPQQPGVYPYPTGGYPQQPTGGYPQQPTGGYPQQPTGGYPQQPTGGYPQQPTGGYPQQPTGGYPQQPTGGYPQQPTGGYPQQPTGGYPQQPTGGYPQPTGGYPQQPSGGYPQPQPTPAPVPAPTNEINPGKETGSSTGAASAELRKFCLSPRGQFPIDKSCGKFVNCWDEIAVESDCPGGLVFNPAGFCDYPYNVDCGNRRTDKRPAMGDKAQCPTLYGAYRSTESCSVFIVCVSGTPVKFDCPEGLNYNDEIGVCDYPYNADCQGTPPQNKVTTVAPYSTTDNYSGQYVPWLRKSPARSITNQRRYKRLVKKS